MNITNQTAAAGIGAPPMRKAKFAIGQVVKHRRYPFRGVIYDVDPVFANNGSPLPEVTLPLASTFGP